MAFIVCWTPNNGLENICLDYQEFIMVLGVHYHIPTLGFPLRNFFLVLWMYNKILNQCRLVFNVASDLKTWAGTLLLTVHHFGFGLVEIMLHNFHFLECISLESGNFLYSTFFIFNLFSSTIWISNFVLGTNF